MVSIVTDMGAMARMICHGFVTMQADFKRSNELENRIWTTEFTLELISFV
ncbi:MAG: hypothetical protein HUU55_05545 [Myxococcales bacterium]|nr:hypothetical protein [Myxococcales bacterium]